MLKVRVGTPGQARDKAPGSAAAAADQRDKLVREKTGKGYRATGAGAEAAASPRPEAGFAQPAPPGSQAAGWGARPGPPLDPAADRTAFRVAEDLALVDLDEALADLEAAAGLLVRLVNPLHLVGGALERWGALFGDCEIAQPFPQLGRKVFRLTGAEADGAEAARFDGAEVPGRHSRGMHPQGWPPNVAGERVHVLVRDLTLADGMTGGAAPGFYPGLWPATSGEGDGVRPWSAVASRRECSARHFGELDTVAANEVLRGPS